MEVAIIGLLILVFSVVLAIFTSNVWVSKKEIDLAELYSKKNIHPDQFQEARYAYLNSKIVLVTRCGVVVGIVLVAIGIYL